MLCVAIITIEHACRTIDSRGAEMIHSCPCTTLYITSFRYRYTINDDDDDFDDDDEHDDDKHDDDKHDDNDE
jgi:hypothetical protein